MTSLAAPSRSLTMAFTRREAMKSVAATGAVLAFSDLDLLAWQVPSFSSRDEIFNNSIVVDDLSGFNPQADRADPFAVVKEAGVTIVRPTLGDVEPETAY